MRKVLFTLLKKDYRLMLSSKFFLLAIGSLVLYSCYINFIYVKMEQESYPVYLCDPYHSQNTSSLFINRVSSLKELQTKCADGFAVGVDASSGKPKMYMVSSGTESIDNYRIAYAISALSMKESKQAEIIGQNDKEMRNRREMAAEVLFFELAAVGFLGLAAMIFKEKQMGVIRVQGILPMNKSLFIVSKMGLFLLCDLIFAAFLTMINLGIPAGILVLPGVCIQAGILSLIMGLTGFICAIVLPDFKQFSLLYLVLAVFITTPVFLVGQTGISWKWINYHPMYHLYMAMKNAYFNVSTKSSIYYTVCIAAVIFLFLLARRGLTREMAKEG